MRAPAVAGEDRRRSESPAGLTRRESAVMDLASGLARPALWWNFAVLDIRKRFRRSVLGPLWLTISMGVMVAALGFLFGQLWGHPLEEFVPYLAGGLIFWGLLTSCITEGCRAWSETSGYVRNVPMPLSVHFYRVVARNLLISVFNMAIYVIVAVVFGLVPSPATLLFIPGMVLFTINIAWMAMVCAVVSTRFRDIPPVIASLVQVAFFVTPVIWNAEQLPQRALFILANPAYHLLQLVRAPLLGQTPALESWTISVSLAALGSAAAVALYARAYRRLPFWV